VFRPDRKHIHHRLLDMGLSRRQVTLSAYGFSLIFLALGFAAFWLRGHWIAVLAGVGVLVVLICAGKLSFSREWFAVGRVLGNSIEIRQMIQYVLSLRQWFALEGGRCRSIEELWQDYTFVVNKLGFLGARLVLPDGERVWERADSCPTSRSLSLELEGGRLGVLELTACRCGEPDAQGRLHRCRVLDSCVSDSRKFEIVTDLVASAWISAAKLWERTNGLPVRLASKLEPATPPATRTPETPAPATDPLGKPPVAPPPAVPGHTGADRA
jgi:hypothetical protein